MADTILLGTVVALNDGSSGAYAECLYCTDIILPEGDIVYTDDTYLNQGNRTITAKPAQEDLGESTLEFKYDITERARYATQRAKTLNQTPGSWRVTRTDGAIYTWSAWVRRLIDVFSGPGNITKVRLVLKNNTVITVT